MSIDRYVARHEVYRDFRGGSRHGFSGCGFVILIALLIGFYGPIWAGWFMGLTIGFLCVVALVAILPKDKSKQKAPHPYEALAARGPAVPAAPTCLCGSNQHGTADHAASGPHLAGAEARYQRGLSEAFKSGEIKVKGRGGE